MRPTKQRFNSHALLRAEAYFRLIVEQENVLLDGFAELTQQRQTIGAVGLDRGRVNEIVMAGSPRRALGHVRVTQQSFRIVAVLRHDRDSHRGAHGHRQVVETKGSLKALEYFLRSRARLARVCRFIRHHGEFIGAQTCDHGTFVKFFFQPQRHQTEQLIAVLEAERVVDFLEVIEVEQI